MIRNYAVSADLEALCGYWTVVNFIIHNRKRCGSFLPSNRYRNSHGERQACPHYWALV
jgi:hypothetical protein